MVSSTGGAFNALQPDSGHVKNDCRASVPRITVQMPPFVAAAAARFPGLVPSHFVGQRADYFPPHAEWEEISGAWIDNAALQGWRRNILEWRSAAAAKANARSEPQSLSGSAHTRGPTNDCSSANLKPPAHGKLLHLGVIRGGPELYPSVRGAMTPVTTPSFSVNIDCLIDTGCLFSNFCKEAIARQLVDFTPIAANARRVVTFADGSTVSTVGSIVCNLRLICNTIAVSLKSVTMHILPELAFDVILGYPTIRKHELLIHFAPLLTGKNLQVHNCMSCCQCLPKVFQQETSLSAGGNSVESLAGELLARHVGGSS